MYMRIQQAVCLALAFLIPPYHALKILGSPKMWWRVLLKKNQFPEAQRGKDREKNYPRRTYNSFHVWGYAFKQKKHTHCPNSSCWVAERPSLVPNIVRLRLQAHHPQKLPVKKKQPLIRCGYEMANKRTAKLVILIGSNWSIVGA